MLNLRIRSDRMTKNNVSVLLHQKIRVWVNALIKDGRIGEKFFSGLNKL